MVYILWSDINNGSIYIGYIPNLFDHYSIDSGWSFPTFIELLLAGILAGQAAIYPPASQQEDDNYAE